jgi:hypothetical protein
MIQKWYKEAEQASPKFLFDTYEFMIYKGFKITLTYEGDSFTLEDVRKSDFYTPVSKSDLLLMKNRGFIKGVDYLSYKRAKRNHQTFKRRIKALYSKREEYKRKYDTKPVFYTNRLSNCVNNIHKNLDLFFFYKVKIKQYEDKY